MVVSWTIILILVVGYLAFSRAESAEDALEAEHARSEALLYNLLPTEIAARLKDAPDQTIADSLDHTAILFADIVDFTPRSARMSPEELVGFLNRIFSTFDRLAAHHGLEKIKTIGDAYMVAAGLPHPVDRPVHRVAKMAFNMLDALRDLSAELGEKVEIRIGLHAGPVVAGVIGHQKLFYDVWGDTVNTASRMESHGAPGRIQVTAAAREALKGDYTFEPRGTVEIKGIGELKTWWLLPGI
jgi:adenylate cyclase/guanylate cyclase